MSYKIKITYDTGDSFKTERDLEQYVEGEWESLEVATENLNRIKEHYEYYEAAKRYHFNSAQRRKAADIIDNAPNQKWYAGDVQDYVYSLKLLTDDNTEYVQHAFWCGYFESLVGAEIEQELPKFRL
jgi:hypothetical protein